ncbi:MAG: hypothetical protein EOO96_01935 [Pedobacter sp.]|nr:MAG: hypothetical protein EOO96_01935 [Pedobacter sp.]
MKILIFILASSLALTACAQTESSNLPKKTNSKTKNTMDLTKISNEKVRQAIEALQGNDKKTWYSYFTANATFTDDGRTLDFKGFFENAFDKKEKFLEINKIEDNGKHITGKFYAGQWGTFNVFFKFHQDADGKFSRLDIGQGTK